MGSDASTQQLYLKGKISSFGWVGGSYHCKGCDFTVKVNVKDKTKPLVQYTQAQALAQVETTTQTKRWQ